MLVKEFFRGVFSAETTKAYRENLVLPRSQKRHKIETEGDVSIVVELPTFVDYRSTIHIDFAGGKRLSRLMQGCHKAISLEFKVFLLRRNRLESQARTHLKANLAPSSDGYFGK